MNKERTNHETSVRNRKFNPLNKPKEEVLYLLKSKGKITELLPPPNSRAKRHDPTKICLYHSNSLGHATKECWALQHKIQNLIKSGELKIASKFEIITTGEDKVKMKGLAYSLEMKSLDEVVAMITSLNKT